MEIAKEEKVSASICDQEELEYKIEIATQTLERNIGFVTNCDNKTSIVLTAIGVLLTIMLTNDGLNAIYNIINNCLEAKTFCSVLFLVCLVSSFFILALGMFNLGSVLVAKTSEKACGLDATNSRIFFSGIRNSGDCKTYRSEFYLMNRQELLDELVAQIYINADIAKHKYNKYNSGLKRAIIGFLLFIVILLTGIYLY